MPGFQFGGSVTTTDRTKLDNLVAPLKTNAAASRLPNKDDDTTEGYAVGSTWIYSGTTYTCTDATDGAAKWSNAADFFYFDTWGAAKTELTKAANGSKYKDKFIQIANANGGPPSGTWTNPDAITTPIADGNGAIYKCTTDAGATASVDLVQRPPASFRLTKIINDKTEAKPTADGNYVWNVTPDAGWAVAGANIGDVLNLTGTTWTVRNKFDDSPNVLYVGDANNNSKPATKYRGKWVNDWDGVVWLDTITTGAELASAINAFSVDTTVYVRTSSKATITLDADATINPTVVFEDLSRVDFKRKDTTDYKITFTRKVTMNGGTFQNINIVLKGAGSTLIGVTITNLEVTVEGSRCAIRECTFTNSFVTVKGYNLRIVENYFKLGDTFTNAALISLSANANHCIIESNTFDSDNKKYITKYWIGRDNSNISQTIIKNNRVISSTTISQGSLLAFVGEPTTCTNNWGGVVIADNASWLPYENAFVDVQANNDGSEKWYWMIINNYTEFYGVDDDSGAQAGFIKAYRLNGVTMSGNNCANTPMRAFEIFSSSNVKVVGNAFQGLLSKGTNASGCTFNSVFNSVVSNNSFHISEAGGTVMGQVFTIQSGSRSIVFNGNAITYEKNPASAVNICNANTSADLVSVTNNLVWLKTSGGSVGSSNWLANQLATSPKNVVANNEVRVA